VPAPPDPTEVLLSMQAVAPEDAPALLAALDAVLGEITLSPKTLRGALLPLLDVEETAGMAARLLGRAGIEDAVDAILGALSRTQRLDNRLAFAEALASLSYRHLALRTLRSIIINGDMPARRRGISTLASVATRGDAAMVRDMLSLVPAVPRLVLAALLYTLGDRGAYAIVAEGWAGLDEATGADDIEELLRATRGTGSKRFTQMLADYAGREARPWFRARALRVAAELSSEGRDEATPQQLVERAEEAYFSSRIAVAIALLEELLELKVKHPRGYYLYANCLKEEQRLDDALAACERALAIDATYWRTHRLRGSLLWDVGRHEESLDAYDEALSLNPVDPYTWYYKGYVLYRLKRDAEALPCLDRALSLKDDSPYIHNQKAFCLERLGRHGDAVRCYLRSLQLKPDDLTIRDYLGQALQVSSRLDDALDCYEEVLKADPERDETLYHRADVLYDLERWEAAADAFALYLERRPESYNAWFNRGLCLRFIGAFSNAGRCFERALSIRPDSANAKRHLKYCRDRANPAR
jgi:tetratricopeptide (TPR) repeat protein